MDKSIAIRVENISKTFRIPHEKISSLRGAFVGALKKKGFDEFNALDGVSFEVKKGEFFGIIGRNGSGKSTLLKILAGIYQADQGDLEIDGLISPFLELGIGFNPELSGRDNVYLNATVLGLTKKQIDEKFESIVAFSELERFIDQKLKNYSSGMQVRLAFSVSIHANRDILLMDEVLAVGDGNFQSKCLEEFNKYRDLGKTVILVTHDINTVQRYCDRAMLLRNGRIVEIGDPEKVGDRYIYQNMSDEERRMHDEKMGEGGGGEADSHKSEKIATISKVEFFDKEGAIKNVFETGADVSVKISFGLKEKVSDLNLGVAIFNQEGRYIFGVNTFAEKLDTSKFAERGYFIVDFKNIPMRSNTYYIKAGIWGESEGVRYDFLDRSPSFKVYSKDRNQGMVNVEYSWQ